jgi:hypothetical protein
LRIKALATLALLAVLLTACDDPNDGIFEPIIREDTVDLAVPLVDPDIPTALDIAYASSGVRGRYPELVADAQEWDLTIRVQDGELRFVPAGVFGFQNPAGGVSTAAVTAPLERAIDEIRQAPGDAQLHADSAVTIRTDRVYVVRSRRTAASFAGCENYAKVQPLALDAAAGTVRLRVIGNARCNDRRLVEED